MENDALDLNPTALALENIVRVVCDHGLLLLAILTVLLAAYFMHGYAAGVPPGIAFPPVGSTPGLRSGQATLQEPTEISTTVAAATGESAQQTPTAGVTNVPTAQASPTLPPTISPTAAAPARNQYVLALIPLAWKGSQAGFAAAARRQADLFLDASQIGLYFDVKVEVVDTVFDTSLVSDTLVEDLVAFGLERVAADRYIGITDGDLGPSSDMMGVSGWTNGPDSLGIVAESDGDSITGHELGHTYGLCDEYSYAYWTEQNTSFENGCPNPYPDNCPKSDSLQTVCLGNPTDDGKNSIMGPSGNPGGYGYNTPSLDHLASFFERLSSASQDWK